MAEIIASGKLDSGKQWRLVPCDRPNPAVKNGRHLMFLVMSGEMPASFAELSSAEVGQMFLIAHAHAQQMASAPGRWTVGCNGVDIASRSYAVWHVILPGSADDTSSLNFSPPA